MFIYREEYYLQRAEPSRRADETTEKMNERYMMWEEAMGSVRGLAEVIIAKQRHGPTGTINLRFYPEATKFDNLDDEDGNSNSRNAKSGPQRQGDVPF